MTILFIFLSCFSIHAYIHKISDFQIDGSARDVIIHNDTAYMIGDGSGLQVIDVINPSSPAFSVSMQTEFNLNAIDLDNNTLYAVGDSIGLIIFDVSEHNMLGVTAGYSAEYNSISIKVDQRIAYIIADGYGLVIYNINNPQSPQLLGSYQNYLRYVFEVEKADSVAYLLDSTGIQFVNVIAPTTPTLINTYDTSGGVKGLAVRNHIAYLLCANHLEILNVENPLNPQLLGIYHFNDDPSDIAQKIRLEGNIAYISSSREVRMVDVSNPQSPMLVSFYQIPVSTNVSLYPNGNHIYLTNEAFDLQVLETSDLIDNLLLTTLHTSIKPNYMDIQGSISYVAYNSLGLKILNVSNPQSPQVLASYGEGNNVSYVKVVGNIAYLLLTGDMGNGLYLVDVSNPENPQLMSRYQTPFPMSATVSDGKAYIYDSGLGLEIINVSNPNLLHYIGSYYPVGDVLAMEVIGNRAYLSISSLGLYILNMDNLLNPTLLGFTDPYPRAKFITIRDSVLYAATEYGGVKIIDISNPTNPAIINTILPSSNSLISSITMKYNLLFLCDEAWDTVYIYNIDDPLNPVILHTIPNNIICDEMVFNDHILYALNGNEGIGIYNYDFVVPNHDQVEIAPIKLSLNNYPNPFNPETTIRFSLPQSGKVQISIFNIKGQLVRNLVDDYRDSGQYSVIWNGFSDYNTPVASGVYFARMSCNGQEKSRKLVLVK